MYQKKMTLGGRELCIETGRMAKQASGSVLIRYVDTMILVTAVANFEKEVEQDFFPLQVEYRERAYAAGKIPGGFFKREGRPSEKEILGSRLIDRPIRPLFPEGFRRDTQIIANVISSDQENPADVLGIIGASAALMISEIPFAGPIAGVRVGRLDGEFILNPTIKQTETSELDIIVAGTEESVVMVEGECKNVSEDLLVDAIEFGHAAIREIVKFQKEIIEDLKPVKRSIETSEEPLELKEKITAQAEAKLADWRSQALISKKAWNDSIRAFVNQVIEENAEEYPEEERYIAQLIDEIVKNDMRRQILETGKRLDGRSFDLIRPITCEIGVLPRAHGSALFTRGETQSLGSVTLGTKLDEQIIDDIDREEFTKKFMLHYNFPPFSVGEVKPIRGTGRREIGHGNLAERALKLQIPSEEDFPYTIRIVSDILESNGSSSMATVCAGSLAMMDAGIPVKETVAGIAMGLIKEGKKIVVLSDIIGAEDHYGDMDFKVTGTREGITAIQMDLKIQGIDASTMRSALKQAQLGRLHIIDIMEQTISKPREKISDFAPRMLTVKVDNDLIGEIIGPGGKNIRAMQAESNTKIEIDDDGMVFISAMDYESAEKGRQLVIGMTAKPEEGKIYRDCTVKRLESYGAFVEFLPNKEGLMHVSEVAWQRTDDINSVLKVGDKVDVLLKKIAAPGRFELSMRELIEKPEGYQEAPRQSRPPRSGGFNDRPRNNNNSSHRPRSRY
ncbi:MAG: polyribonucleotide nucleotidyltransferase [Candidatus Marinimicrobia bacterium]|nr:polyribonucleotide nucleotidyltransferase [Candidatus Neomarinimicrobiota bacterium]MCK9482963.1 polyribonucleotide nucleotidyltransferase [Candidatus Neomarinimicrobiota bacterium]MCK9559014.1 polyribonucleotide nucleotidyltransferase [Candidatus Neomarinimicrobiota bacterium]MDD5061950.1 polyribonucleotide nucleotidyltransferase [Candidatus Neomarinimicrobiota bacterium]MDD5539420.1 polyribonucleotide nucleotidyltransferase [Candidatus Neomarinimicrobiota bacterium]